MADPLEKLLASISAALESAQADLAGEHAAPAAARPDVLAGCFPEELAFIRDPRTLKFAFCTRRAAKSYGVGLEMFDDALDHPRANYIIIGLNRLETKKIYWKDVLKDIDARHRLGCKFNETELTCTLPNGATIHLTGADANEEEHKKLLGGKNRKVAVDEAQSWATDLEHLVFAVLRPSVADHRGSIALIGTPGNLTRGFFARVTKGCRAGKLSPPDVREPGWSGHSWTTFQNPFLREQWQADIEELRAANPGIDRVPWFRQMYLGEWVIDLDTLCYKFSLDRNAVPALPILTDRRGRWHHVLGIDLGYSPDPSAFVVAAYHDHDQTLYFVESWKQWRMDITDVAERVKHYASKYEFDALVIDGANRQAVEEMRRRHGLPLLSADKTGKSDFIELMNAEFILGRLKLITADCSQGLQNSGKKAQEQEALSLHDEYQGLVWDERALARGKREEHPGCPNHLADAALYAWRHCYQYLSKAPERPPEPYSPEWFRREAERMHEEEIEEMLARKGEETVGLGDSENWESWTH